MGRRAVARAGDRGRVGADHHHGRPQRGPIEEIGGQGVFTKEIQLALLDGRIDLAVHSLKDLPTAATPGLSLAAVPERGPPGDALVLPLIRHTRVPSLDVRCLPSGAAIGTGSLRRRAQLLHFRRDLQMKDIRGNVDTRLRKLHEGGYDALLLAEAGLRRLGLADEIAEAVPLEIVLPAAGQGALALETRARRRLDPPNRRPAGSSPHARRGAGRAGAAGGARRRLPGAGGRAGARRRRPADAHGPRPRPRRRRRCSKPGKTPPRPTQTLGRQVAEACWPKGPPS